MLLPGNVTVCLPFRCQVFNMKLQLACCRCSVDKAKPTVDLESSALVSSFMHTFLGDPMPPTPPAPAATTAQPVCACTCITALSFR